METSAISYRVADFLRRHPPFHVMEDADLLELSARGRVRFYEANEYVMWQGEPHKSHVYVIQQGTVSLWDESDSRAVLRDVRGEGDMLGLESFTGAPCCLHSATSGSDVVVYGFPVLDFADLVLKYPYARQFVESQEAVNADYAWERESRDPQRTFLHDVIRGEAPETCRADERVRDVARRLAATGRDALPVVDADGRVRGTATTEALIGWIARGGGDADASVSTIVAGPPPVAGPGVTVTDGVLAMAAAGTSALAVTSDGSSTGRLEALVTTRELARAFGDQPTALLREIRRASTLEQLGELNRRVRALALAYLTGAASVEWLARVLSLSDVAILARAIALVSADLPSACWCVCGASGREESLTRHEPSLVLITADGTPEEQRRQAFGSVCEALAGCGYLARADVPFDRAFHAARLSEWRERYVSWVRDPVRTEMYLARPLFDLRPVHGERALWDDVVTTLTGAVDRDFLHVLANDCLASLPPLTFFQDAVVEKSGEQTTVFRLEESALRPLVDVARVFGMAAGRTLGTSTRERLAGARSMHPEHDAVFRDASETLSILLWQQARVGISQDTTGSELPPSVVGRHDRHVLKSGFRSILHLIEMAHTSFWVESV